MKDLAENHSYDQIREWLSNRCGIIYPDHKLELFRQRLTRVIRSFNLADFEALARAVVKENKTDVQLAVMHAASTNHTFFFREREVLDVFEKRILPSLMNRNEIRIWSAAASTGDEAYTIGIIAAETQGQAALNKLKILGTDISAPVVQRAELAVYHKRQFAQTDPTILKKYFTPMGIEQYRVNDSIRNVCTFRRMNLKATPYPFKHPFQVVFCRNILYYFDRVDQVATLNAIYDVTEPGGWLLTSVTEPIRDLGSKWEQIETGVYRRNQ